MSAEPNTPKDEGESVEENGVRECVSAEPITQKMSTEPNTQKEEGSNLEENGVRMEGDEGDTEQKDLEDTIDYRCQLRVMFPCILPTFDEIKALHPGITHVFPRMNRKNPRLCFLAFSTPESAEKAMEELTSKPYKDMGHLDVRLKDDWTQPIPVRRVKPDEERRKLVLIRGISSKEPEEKIVQEFRRFGCVTAHVYRKDQNEVLKKGCAQLTFNTVKDSEAFVANKEVHVYKQSSLKVDFFGNPGPTKAALMRHRRKERRKMNPIIQLTK